jgi:hypothetical protein
MTAVAVTGLRDELRAIDQKHPHWHSFVSDQGRLWSVTSHTPTGLGYTVSAGAPQVLDLEIAKVERLWHLPRGSAA